MDTVSSDQQGGAHKHHKTGDLPEKYTDCVGSGAGEQFATGSADGEGTDRGFCAKRAVDKYNPQNTHEVVQKEYKRIPHVGPTTFPSEP